MKKLLKFSLDEIMATNKLCRFDTSVKKMDLVIGSYKSKNGFPYVFQSVKYAKNILSNDYYHSHEYLPIIGDSEYLQLSKKLYFRHPTNFNLVQTLGGTGSLSLASQFVRLAFDDPVVYLSNPTWPNHTNIFSSNQIKTYDYLNKRKFDFEYLYDSIDSIESINQSYNNIILLHGCAHNPTGYDLTSDEWRYIFDLVVSKNIFPIIDLAYLGFATGNVNKDSTVVNILNEYNCPALVCTSYSKNFGLYSERVGCLFFRGSSIHETECIQSMLERLIRTTYSNPPKNGSDIVKTILASDGFTNMWLDELKDINNHYIGLRHNLRNKLENKINDSFHDVTLQTGMFYYPEKEFTQEQISLFRQNSIYFPNNGRISLAGLTDDNIDHFVDTYTSILK